MKKIIRATTAPQSLTGFCTGLLRELSNKYEVVALSSPGPEMQVIEEQEGVRTIAVPMERRISLLKDLKALCKLVRVFAKERPDMIHSMTPKAGLLCMVAAWVTRVPVRVHTFTGLVFPTAVGLKKRILMLTDKLTCACATHVIPEGEGVKSDLVNHHITKKPMKVLGYGNIRGVDMDYYSRNADVQAAAGGLRDESRFTFLYVGRIVRDKGINELVSAFQKLFQDFPQVRLVLVGAREDDLDPIPPSTVDVIERSENIFAVGRKEGVDLLAWYAAADCFVFPSYREGFPNTVLEAGAMGLPCIVTDINGSREIITDGYNGLIVPPRDEEALNQAMRLMVDNPQERERMASVARERIAMRFEQKFVRQCLYDFYSDIL